MTTPLSLAAVTIRANRDQAAWTLAQIAEQRRLRVTRATVLGMLEKVLGARS